MFSIMDWESHRSTPPFEFTTLRIHWYDPISSGYLTAELGISKCRYDDMTLLIDALTVTPVFFSNFLSCQNDDVTFVTDTTLLSDLFNWMLEIPMILVPYSWYLPLIFHIQSMQAQPLLIWNQLLKVQIQGFQNEFLSRD